MAVQKNAFSPDRQQMQVEMDSPAGREAAAGVLDETLRDVAGRDRYEIGEYTTPALVADLMLELANPVPGERVYDPCFGFGGLLLGIAQRLHAAARTDSFGVWGDIHRTGIFGIEVDRVSYGIGLCRTLLAGIERPGLAFGDALDRALPDSRSNDGFDCILAAPPWGRKASHRHAGPQPVFERRGGETDEPEHLARTVCVSEP